MDKKLSSTENFKLTLQKLSKSGDRGIKILKQLVDEVAQGDTEKQENLKKLFNSLIEKDSQLRIKRDVFINSPLSDLMKDDESGNAAIEEVFLQFKINKTV